jgi:hypothetical protein
MSVYGSEIQGSRDGTPGLETQLLKSTTHMLFC